MSYLVFIALTATLLLGYLGLIAYEARRGARVFAAHREALDHEVERALFIVQRVDLVSFVRSEALRIGEIVIHDIVHGVLLAVRTAERLLSRAVRYLRTRRADAPAAAETSRPFVQALSSFKEHLEATRPEMPDIHESDKVQ